MRELLEMLEHIVAGDFAAQMDEMLGAQAVVQRYLDPDRWNLVLSVPDGKEPDAA